MQSELRDLLTTGDRRPVAELAKAFNMDPKSLKNKARRFGDLIEFGDVAFVNLPSFLEHIEGEKRQRRASREGSGEKATKTSSRKGKPLDREAKASMRMGQLASFIAKAQSFISVNGAIIDDLPSQIEKEADLAKRYELSRKFDKLSLQLDNRKKNLESWQRELAELMAAKESGGSSDAESEEPTPVK